MKSFALLPLLTAAVLATDHAPQTHTVIVGGVKPNPGGDPTPMLLYQPESIKAHVGDKVKFKFLQANHTVTESTFDNPCKKKDGGADSGFMPNMDGKDGVEWEYEVETEEAIWMYCKQRTGTHCGKGMVFAINAADDGDKTFAAYKQLAIKINGTDLEPSDIQKGKGEALPDGYKAKLGEGGVEDCDETKAVPEAAPTVVAGHGVDGKGDSCQCSCLCGWSSFPDGLGANGYGGYGGMMPRQ